MQNPVIDERMRQFRRVADEERRSFVLFAAAPCVYWTMVFLDHWSTGPDYSTHPIEGITGIISAFLAIVAWTWAAGTDATPRQKVAWWGLAFFLASPVLSWLMARPA